MSVRLSDQHKISLSLIYTPTIFVNGNKGRQLSQKNVRRESEEGNRTRIELFYKKAEWKLSQMNMKQGRKIGVINKNLHSYA